MDNAATLVQPHAVAILDSLVNALRSPDSRAKLAAAKQILRWAWGPPGAKRQTAGAVPAGGLRHAQQQRAVELLLPHLGPEPKGPKGSNPAATSCPARHEAAAPADASKHLPQNPAIAPMSLESNAPARAGDAVPARATTPCPAADATTAANPVPPNPVVNPMSRESGPSPLVAPAGTDSSRRDADPMSRALLLARHRDDAFRRPLPQPPPIEPPWPFLSEAQWRARRRRPW